MGSTVTPLRLMTLEETAALLRKTPSQLRWMRHNGTGPRSAKIGGRILFLESEVVHWVEAAFSNTEAA